MIKLYGAIALIAILGGVGYGAKYYYDTTQNTIAQLRDNNAKLEVAVDTAQNSVEALQGDMAKLATLNKGLQQDLQKAEAYGDELRSKLSKLDLVVEALKNSKSLEKITRVFFMHKRKMIKKPYNLIFNGDIKTAEKLNIKLNLRPQNLNFETYFKLADEYEKLRS